MSTERPEHSDFKQANHKYVNGDFAGATTAFRRIIETYPGTTEAYRSAELLAELTGDVTVQGAGPGLSGHTAGGDGFSSSRLHVVVTDIDIPFGSMVMLIIKWSLAAIPAALAMWVVMFSLSMFFAAFGGGLLK